MKVIFFAIAMDREAKPLYSKLESLEKKEINGYTFYEGILFDKKIVIGLSTIGLINMSSLVTTAKMNYDIDCIINYGLSGGYTRDLHVGDLIIGTSCLNIGSYVSNIKSNSDRPDMFEYTYKYITFTDGGEDKLVIYKSADRLIELCDDIHIENQLVYKGRLGSSDAWNKEYDKIVQLKTEYKILCEDMESAAVFQMADRYKIDALSIKVISNNEILHEEYSNNVVNNVVDYVLELIKKI